MKYYGIPLLCGLVLTGLMLLLSAWLLDDGWTMTFRDVDMLYGMMALPCGWMVLTRWVRRLKGGKGHMNPVLKIIMLSLMPFYWYLKMIPSLVIGFVAGPYYAVCFVIAVVGACMGRKQTPEVIQGNGHEHVNDDADNEDHGHGTKTIGFSMPHD